MDQHRLPGCLARQGTKPREHGQRPARPTRYGHHARIGAADPINRRRLPLRRDDDEAFEIAAAQKRRDGPVDDTLAGDVAEGLRRPPSKARTRPGSGHNSAE
jgi:hypothetical protein